MYEIYESLLKEKGITSYKVSKYTGVNQAVISGWKTGRSIPKMEALKKIADYLGVTVDYLCGNTDKTDENYVYTVSPEEASSVILKQVAGDEKYNQLSLQDKRNFERQLLELAELAYLKITS